MRFDLFTLTVISKLAQSSKQEAALRVRITELEAELGASKKGLSLLESQAKIIGGACDSDSQSSLAYEQASVPSYQFLLFVFHLMLVAINCFA